MRMEEFLRAGTHDPGAWQALLERQRAGRDAYYTAVREDLALPPGHAGRWQLPPAAATGLTGSTPPSAPPPPAPRT
jgi:hypothetical protein